jgi:hypothetical protein
MPAWEARVRAFDARCLEAATSPWRIRFAELLVERVAALSAGDLRRMSRRDLARLGRRFGWLVLDESPPYDFGMVLRPDRELLILWDGRRRSAKKLNAFGVMAAYRRIRAEGDRRADLRERRWWRRRPEVEPIWRRQQGLPARPLILPRTGRAPRRVVRVARRQRRLALSRGDDEPGPPGRALLPAGARQAVRHHVAAGRPREATA